MQQDYDNNHAADGRLKKDWGTSNIFNIVSSGDVIPRILPAEWGFYRNGNDRFLPSTVIPAELQALNDRSAGMEGTPMDFGRLAVSEETDAVLRSMLDLFCDRQTYYEDYEDAMRCMLQCATTRTEEEVTRGIVRDDAAVVAQLRSMELMQRFPQEKVERCVQAASALSRPVLESWAARCRCRRSRSSSLCWRWACALSCSRRRCSWWQTCPVHHHGKGAAERHFKDRVVPLSGNYITVLEAYDPADHGMTPYTRREEL